MEQKEKQTFAAVAGVTVGTLVYLVWTGRKERKKRDALDSAFATTQSLITEHQKRLLAEYEKNTDATIAAWNAVIDKEEHGGYTDTDNPNAMVDDFKFYRQVLREE